MKRSTPLKRKTPLRSRSRTKKYRRRERDLGHMAIVRRLPCIVRFIGSFTFPPPHQWPMMYSSVITLCTGRVQADHAGTRALSQKAPDDTTIPMCRNHHGERTDYRGTFKNWDAAMMRTFNDWAIEKTRRDVADVMAVR